MGAIKILIVEDEAIIASTMEARLEKLGYAVMEAVHSGEDALEALQTDQPDLILLDINLEKGGGKIDGIQTAAKIKELYGIPFIYLSAFSDKETIERAKNTLPATYLLKPFKEADVQIAIEMAIANFSKQASENKTAAQPAKTEEPAEDEPEAAGETPTDHAYLIKDCIFIKDDQVHIKIKIDDILFVQSSSNYVIIHTLQKEYVLCNTLIYVAKLIDKPNFFRPHQSYLVNLEHMSAFEKDCIYVGKHFVPISRAHQADFHKHLQILKSK